MGWSQDLDEYGEVSNGKGEAINLQAPKVSPPEVSASQTAINAWARRSGPAGWFVEDKNGRGVHVAPWVVDREKKNLFRSLVGCLRDGRVGHQEVEH